MPRFDEPEADWTDDYPWTRYRGPTAYPVPGGWVLNDVEGDGIGWRYYEGLGEEHEKDHHVRDALEYDEYEERLNDAPEAVLIHHVEELNMAERTETQRHELSISKYDEYNETVLNHTNPEWDDLMRVCAEVLDQFDDGVDPEEIEFEFESGRLPASVRERQKQERRREENQSIDEFAGGEE